MPGRAVLIRSPFVTLFQMDEVLAPRLVAELVWKPEEALAKFGMSGKEDPEVVIMDGNGPNLAAYARIRSMWPKTKFVVITLTDSGYRELVSKPEPLCRLIPNDEVNPGLVSAALSEMCAYG